MHPKSEFSQTALHPLVITVATDALAPNGKLTDIYFDSWEYWNILNLP